MSLRSGGGAFRSLGRLSVRPRPYQMVPLLMALPQETMRLLIADDVGVGKTIEAGLILREMLDRREIQRIAVLCPPQLCDRWQQELAEKFHIDAVVVPSGTISKLERQIPSGDRHLFDYYRHLIVSLDYVKSDRRRASFLAYCPDCVVVDEARTGDNLTHAQRRGRYWSALAIVRCVMSSPAAAVATLQRQASRQDTPEIEVPLSEDPLFDEDLAAAYVDDPTEQERTSDMAPSAIVERGKQTYSDRERRLLREFVKAAQGLQENGDRKLQREHPDACKPGCRG